MSRPRRRIGVLIALSAVMLAPCAGAQQRPDFSGAWTAVSASNAGRGRGGGPSGDMGSGWGSEISIRQHADSLVVERVFFAPGDLQPALTYRFALDGMESTNTVMMGRGIREQVSTAAWQGETLVITTAYAVPAHEAGEALTGEVKHVLSLQPSPSLVRPPSLLVETTRSGVLGGPTETTRTVYRRR